MTSEEDKILSAAFRSEILAKVKRNLKEGPKEGKKRFLAKYPYANLSKFEFKVILKDNGDVDKYETYYKISDISSFDITSDTFQNNKEWKKNFYWQEPWGVRGTVQSFIKNSSDLTVNSFKIYVTNDLFFDVDFPKFEIKNNESSNDYKDNPYLAALFAAYITTYTCGMSTEHFTYNQKTPKIITSIARYHLYYHMKRFMRQPNKMSRYITQEMKKLIMDNKPEVFKWTREFHSGKEQLGYWLSKQPRGTIRNAKVVMSANNSGQLGISYMKKGAQTIKSLDDYKIFIATKSDGLTKTGQLLFQQSVESYVYCVLGAQANTRWSIVGRGALSIQTQEVFKKLVNDTIIQSDQTVTIANMRKVIKDTNVVLNMAISPGVILIPSNLIILDKMEVGYNNILKLAASGMKFSKNDEVNYVKPKASASEPEPKATTVSEPKVNKPEVSVTTVSEPKGYSDVYLLAVALISGSLISRFIV